MLKYYVFIIIIIAVSSCSYEVGINLKNQDNSTKVNKVAVENFAKQDPFFKNINKATSLKVGNCIGIKEVYDRIDNSCNEVISESKKKCFFENSPINCIILYKVSGEIYKNKTLLKKILEFMKNIDSNSIKSKKELYILARIYATGFVTIKKNLKKSLGIALYACKLGYSDLCANAAALYITMGDKTNKARLLAEKACNLNSASGCVALSVIYSGGIGEKKNLLLVKRYASKACKLNDISGCYNLGIYYQREKEYRNAFKFFNYSCNLNYASACRELGLLYLRGLGGLNKSPKIALKKFKKACVIDRQKNCNRMVSVQDLGGKNHMVFYDNRLRSLY